MVKMKLVDALRSAGYDMLSACENADKYIKEFLKSKEQRRTVVISGARGKAVAVFRLERKAR